MPPEDKNPEVLFRTEKALLNSIAELKAQEKELQEKTIPDLLKDANKPVYDAKAEAEKILADAKAEAEKITEDANKQALDVKNKAKGLEEDASSLLAAAKRKNADALDLKTKTEKDRAEFDTDKYASEANLNTRKTEAEALMGDALVEQARQKERKTSLDARESVVIKKEEDLKEHQAAVENLKKDNQGKIDELKAVEQAHAEGKIEIAMIKSQNEDILNGIKSERKEKEIEVEKARKIFASALEKEKEVDGKNRVNSNQLSSLAKDIARNEEQLKTINEKDRLAKIYEREIDRKINDLKKLRAADADLRAAAKPTKDN